jgi:carbamoyltransferase
MTQRVGLVPQRDEYMIANMGKDSDPEHFKSIIKSDLIKRMPGMTDPRWLFKENLHRGCRWWRPEIKTDHALRTLAAATQSIFEEALDGLSMYAKTATGSKHLALAGGGALNRQAVNKIKRDWTSIHVPPNPGDPGSCIGAVLAKTKQKIIIDNQWHKTV